MRHTRCLCPCSAATALHCVLSCRYFLAAQSSLALEISLQSISRDSLISNIMSKTSDKKCMNSKAVTSFKDVQKIYIFLAWSSCQGAEFGGCLWGGRTWHPTSIPPLQQGSKAAGTDPALGIRHPSEDRGRFLGGPGSAQPHKALVSWTAGITEITVA